MFKLCWTFNIAMRRRGSFLLYFVICACQWSFLSDPGVPGVRSMGPSLSNWGRFCRYNWCDSAFWRYQLNTNNNANRAIQGNVTMQVMQPGGQICNICKCCHLMANFGTNASGATWWTNFEPMQVVYMQIGNCHKGTSSLFGILCTVRKATIKIYSCCMSRQAQYIIMV